MRISVFGLGYVGSVCVACFASRNHEVIGIDISQTKVDLINSGKSPIVEDELENLLNEGLRSKRLMATTNTKEGILNSEVSFVCVGTPSKRNGDLDLTYLKSVSYEIGEALKDKQEYHVVAIRSTVLPETIREIVMPTLESASGKKTGKDFGIVSNPEFLRESTAIQDFNTPSMTIIGGSDQHSIDLIAGLYEDLKAPIVRCSFETSAMIKYACNAWHAIKVGFANEIGSISKSFGVDGREVMDTLCLDEKLNISPYYLKPGFAFGGSCLPKDVRALTYNAKKMDVDIPILESIMESNKTHINRAFDLVNRYGKRKIGLMGLSYKAKSDDLRESPFVELAEMLIGKGFDVKIFDYNIRISHLFGANKEYINEKIPHISALLCETPEMVVQASEILIFGHKDEHYKNIFQNLPPEKKVIDLAGLMGPNKKENEEGLCW